MSLTCRVDAEKALETLRSAGIKLEVIDLKLRATGPLTDELRKLLKEHHRWLTGLVDAEQNFELERIERSVAGHKKRAPQ